MKKFKYSIYIIFQSVCENELFYRPVSNPLYYFVVILLGYFIIYYCDMAHSCNYIYRVTVNPLDNYLNSKFFIVIIIINYFDIYIEIINC